jgi:hypothetical protein
LKVTPRILPIVNPNHVSHDSVHTQV